MSRLELRSVAGALMAALLCLPALASEPRCDTDSFPDTLTGISTAKIDTGKVSIMSDAEGCPEAGDRCATKAYLLDGDTVFAAQSRGNFRCVAFLGKRGQTTGWIRQDALSPTDEGGTNAWGGTWNRARGAATLTIRRDGEAYIADLLATASTANPENVRTGAASGEMRIHGKQAALADGDGDDACHVEIVQLGHALLVNDGGTEDANSPCDGMGVTLNGIYRRTPR